MAEGQRGRGEKSKIRLGKFGEEKCRAYFPPVEATSGTQTDTATPVRSTRGTRAHDWLNFPQNPKSKIHQPLATSHQPLAKAPLIYNLSAAIAAPISPTWGLSTICTGTSSKITLIRPLLLKDLKKLPSLIKSRFLAAIPPAT